MSESPFTLAPGEKKENITYTYTVLQKDVDAGKIDNTVTATGKDPKNADVTDDASATVTTVTAAPALKVTKTAGSTSYYYNDTVTYTITVENTGNVTVSGITVADELTGGVTPADAFDLAPGKSMILTATYKVTAADAGEGSVKNEAVATGTAPDGNPVEAKGDVTVNAEKIAIEITAASDKKVYDGKELTNDGYEQTSGTLVTGSGSSGFVPSVTVRVPGL